LVLVVDVVMEVEGIPHGPLGERLLRKAHLGLHLALLDHRLPPVNGLSWLIHYVVGVADGVELLHPFLAALKPNQVEV